MGEPSSMGEDLFPGSRWGSFGIYPQYNKINNYSLYVAILGQSNANFIALVEFGSQLYSLLHCNSI